MRILNKKQGEPAGRRNKLLLPRQCDSRGGGVGGCARMGIPFDNMPRQMILAALYGVLKFMANGLVYRQLLVEMPAFLKQLHTFLFIF